MKSTSMKLLLITGAAAFTLARAPSDAAAWQHTEMMGVTNPGAFMLRATGNFGSYNLEHPYSIPSPPFPVMGTAIVGDTPVQMHVIAFNGAFVRHNVRQANNTWGTWDDVNARVGQNIGATITKAALCRDSVGVHLFALTTSSLKHTIRFHDGTWQQGWGDVRTATGMGAAWPITDVGCAGGNSDGSMGVYVVYDGDVLYSRRFTSGAWWPFFNMVSAPTGEPFTKLGVVRNGIDVHVMAATKNGTSRRLWHTIGDGLWFGSWSNALTLTGWTHPNSNIRQISAAQSLAGVDFIVLPETGVPWMTTRKTNTQWNPFFDLRQRLGTSYVFSSFHATFHD